MTTESGPFASLHSDPGRKVSLKLGFISKLGGVGSIKPSDIYTLKYSQELSVELVVPSAFKGNFNPLNLAAACHYPVVAGAI